MHVERVKEIIHVRLCPGNVGWDIELKFKEHTHSVPMQTTGGTISGLNDWD